MNAKKIIAPVLLLSVIAVIAVIAYMSFMGRQTVTVTGLIGSEKKAFFDDPDVQQILLDEYNLQVDFETVGSRKIATVGGARGKVSDYDFAFPAGTPASEKIARDYQPLASYRVFFTPMTVASWQPVVEVLQNNGIVEQKQTAKGSYYRILQMPKLLELMRTETRWQDLPNNQGFDIGRQVLIKSTNITSSNSAAMYLSLASYLANGNQVVSNQSDANRILGQMLPLFANQGFLAGSSATPFEDYLIKGMGNSPMVMIYESQYLHQASMAGGVRDDMVLMYPTPTIFTQHTLLAMTEAGQQLGDALTQNEALQRLAIKHGYRSNNPALVSEFQTHLQSAGIDNVPSQLTEVIDPPSYEVLEGMIVDIEQRLAQ